jgi:hypothetical protein
MSNVSMLKHCRVVTEEDKFKRIYSATMLLPLQGVPSFNASTQGDALG